MRLAARRAKKRWRVWNRDLKAVQKVTCQRCDSRSWSTLNVQDWQAIHRRWVVAWKFESPSVSSTLSEGLNLFTGLSALFIALATLMGSNSKIDLSWGEVSVIVLEGVRYAGFVTLLFLLFKLCVLDQFAERRRRRRAIYEAWSRRHELAEAKGRTLSHVPANLSWKTLLCRRNTKRS